MNGDSTIICQRVGMLSVRSTAPGGALVREVSPVEEPAESAAKKRQCVRYHWPKERKKSAKSARASSKRRTWSGGRTEEDCQTAGENIGWVEGMPYSAIAQDAIDRER